MLNLKPTHKIIQSYYQALQALQEARVEFNGQVSELGNALVKILTAELHTNLAFQEALT